MFFACFARVFGEWHTFSVRYLFVLPGAATRFRSLAPGYVLVALSARVFTRKKTGVKTSRSSPWSGRIFAETPFRSRRDEGQGPSFPIKLCVEKTTPWLCGFARVFIASKTIHYTRKSNTNFANCANICFRTRITQMKQIKKVSAPRYSQSLRRKYAQISASLIEITAIFPRSRKTSWPPQKSPRVSA